MGPADLQGHGTSRGGSRVERPGSEPGFIPTTARVAVGRGMLSKMMKDASRSKDLALRVREDNAAREVQGPDRGVERAAPYLFPSEFLALMDCGRVPARWKRLIMLATYLYVRARRARSARVERR